jgi:acyl-coenzyme A thioesterase PaaI-like protein
LHGCDAASEAPDFAWLIRTTLATFRAEQREYGTIQGGMLAAMLDSATGNAVMASLPHDRTAVTTRLDTTVVKPVALGPLTPGSRKTARSGRKRSVRPSKRKGLNGGCAQSLRQ